MPTSKSIIFELNNNFRVYVVTDSVNQSDMNLDIVRELERDGKVLELADRFEFLWQDLEENKYLDNATEIYFLIGDKAGFTDTRIVYIWLKSWQMFNSQKKFYLHRIQFDVTINLLSDIVLKDLFDRAKSKNNSTEISYSKEPNITRK